MADAIAPRLLSILTTLQRQYDPASINKQDLDDLEVLIEETEQLLKKAYSMETIDMPLKEFIKRARKFLYDTQDAVEDFMLHESRRHWLGLLPVFSRKFVFEAKDFKEMLQGLRTDISSRALAGQSPADLASSSLAYHSSSIAFSEENDGQLEGIDDARKQLVEWLIKDDSMSKVVFVHGAQGVGKTSLVGTVLRNQQVEKRFKYYVWIKDSRSHDVLTEANVEMWDLTQKDIRRAQLKLGEAFKRMEKDDDWNNNCRWVLVLDDVRKPHLIESLQSYLDPTCPSVLITTCDSSLELYAKELASASSISAVTQRGKSDGEAPHSFNGFLSFKHVSLSKNHSRELLHRRMETLTNGQSPDVLPNDSESILEICQGLPLAILATCDLLKDKLSGLNGTSQSVDWGNLNGRLGEELLSIGHPSDLIRRMTTLRMDQLHDVRACLFYLSIFPLDCPIRCSTLMRLWMAERFSMQEYRGTNQAIAEENLRKLLDRNFIQEVEKTSYGRVRTFRVHNLLHEIIMKKSKDDEFVRNVADLEERWPEPTWRLSLNSSLRRSASADVSLETPDKKDESQTDGTKDGTRGKKLRSLLIFKQMSTRSLEKLLKQADRLNVLHIEASPLYSFPKGILRLKYLRYLKLSSTNVQRIPEHIRHLTHLETLDLKGTCVRKLPKGILELKALCHLLVYKSEGSPYLIDSKLGVKAPSALGDLKSLQKLCMIELNPVKPNKLQGKHWKRQQLLGELAKLTSLRRLGISMLRSEDVGLLCSSIKKLTELEALHLIAAPEEIIDFSHEGKAPIWLQRVHLTGRLRKLPNWLLSPDNLVKLILKRSQLSGDALQHLGELRGLKHLELQQAFDICEMTIEKGWFPQLRFLGLANIDRLHSIIVDEEALPVLEILSLARCPSLTAVPQDIIRRGNLTCLKHLDMPEEFNRSLEENEADLPKMTINLKNGNSAALETVMLLPQHPPAGRPLIFVQK